MKTVIIMIFVIITLVIMNLVIMQLVKTNSDMKNVLKKSDVTNSV